MALAREREVVHAGRAGADVVLTIDLEVQEVLERALAGIMRRSNPQPGAGGVVLDADTGEVLAIASMPQDWWHELAPVGTRADAHAHLDRLEAVGVDTVTMYPAPEVDLAVSDLELISEIARQRT